MRRRGFTIIELLVVMILLGILTGIALLKSSDLRNGAIAAQVTQDFHAVQVASFNYFADHEKWPEPAGPGVVPDGLGPLLPGQLAGSFTRDRYTLEYELLGDEGGAVVGISVTSSDAKLFAKLVAYLGNKSAYFVSGSKITYIISGPGGVF